MPPLFSQHKRHTLPRVIVNGHAIKALKTFIIPDRAVLLDRVVIASDLAELARAAALQTARDPVPYTQQTAKRHDGAERADITAKALEEDRPQQQPRDGIGDEIPFTEEIGCYRRFEGFDLCCLIQIGRRGKGQDHEARK